MNKHSATHAAQFFILLTGIILSTSFSAMAESMQIQKANEDFYGQLDRIVQNVNPRKNTKWSLSKISLNTSNTHEGFFGLMPFKGTATATLSWIPKTISAKSNTQATDIKSFDLSIKAEDATYVATVWYREFLRTKKLPWNTDNEKKFLDLFKQARLIAQEIAQTYQPEWYIDQFVVERGLTVKGSLAPLLTAEAAFAIRFSFDLNSVKPPNTNKPSELNSLVLGLAEDISTSAKKFGLANWEIDGFHLGLGVNPLFGVGVVNAKPYAFAHMIFKPRKKSTVMSLAFRQQLKTTTSPYMRMFDYADSGSLTIAAEEKAYIINRDKFRKGLDYALSLAKKMTLQADKGDNSKKKWRLGQAVYRYETGVTGEFLFAGLKGKIGAEVSIAKKLAALQEIAPLAFDMMDITANNADMQKALNTELQENKKILSIVPAGLTLSAVESSASLKFSFGIDSPLADLKISAIPQVRLKFSPLK